MTKNKFHNRTRTTKSIPRKLIRERKYHYLPLYALLRLSRLSNEAMNNSGSYNFADHIYRFKSEGTYGVGRIVDWTVLRLPSARDFRQRYIYAKKVIADLGTEKEGLKILVAPAGLAREVFEHGELITKKKHLVHGLDLDHILVDDQNKKAKSNNLPIAYFQGDMLDPSHYPEKSYDLIICMGLTEFLEDSHAEKLFKIFKSKLASGGTLYTSSTNVHKFSDKLLRNLADLHTNYRSEEDLYEILKRAGFMVQTSHVTKNKLQTIVRAKKT